MRDDLDSLFFPMSEESYVALSKKIEKVKFQIGEVDSQIEEIRCKIREADLVRHKVFKMLTDHENKFSETVRDSKILEIDSAIIVIFLVF